MADLMASLEYCVKMGTEPDSPARARMMEELAEIRSKASEYDATITRLNALWAENEALRAVLRRSTGPVTLTDIFGGLGYEALNLWLCWGEIKTLDGDHVVWRMPSLAERDAANAAAETEEATESH